MTNALEKLEALGPFLPYPHSSDVRGVDEPVGQRKTERDVQIDRDRAENRASALLGDGQHLA